MAVPHRITSLDFPLPPGPHLFATRQPWDLPILARDVSGRAWGLGPRRVRPGLAFSPRAIVPSATPRASAPWSGGISRLDTQPVRTPVNASPEALRLPAHDSGPVWIATPSPYDSFIHYIPSIFIGAPAKAGIQSFQIDINYLDSGFHRSDAYLVSERKPYFLHKPRPGFAQFMSSRTTRSSNVMPCYRHTGLFSGTPDIPLPPPVQTNRFCG